jgi:hypothetical protein
MKYARITLSIFAVASAVMPRPSFAVIPVFDAVNDASNLIQNVQLALIKKALTNKNSGVVYNTTNIDKSTKKINKSMTEITTFNQMNIKINSNVTWNINKGGEIIPVPRGIEPQLKAVHGGSVSDYLDGFKDAKAHLSADVEGDGAAELFAGSRARKAANDMLVNAIELEQASLSDEAKVLKTLRTNGENAVGHGHQLQVANVLAVSQVNQMMKLRNSLMIAEVQRAAEAQVAADRDARAIATSVKMRDGLEEAISGLPMLHPVR